MCVCVCVCLFHYQSDNSLTHAMPAERQNYWQADALLRQEDDGYMQDSGFSP